MDFHLFTHPFFLGYAAVIVVLWRAGTGLKHMAQQADARRKNRIN